MKRRNSLRNILGQIFGLMTINKRLASRRGMLLFDDENHVRVGGEGTDFTRTTKQNSIPQEVRVSFDT